MLVWCTHWFASNHLLTDNKKWLRVSHKFAAMSSTPLVISSPNVKYTNSHIFAEYEYEETLVSKKDGVLTARPYKSSLSIRTGREVGRVGVMLVGWGGNNGTTFTAAVLANKHRLSWYTRTGKKQSNWYGSITQASTVRLGIDETGNDVYVPMTDLLPMVNPNDLVIDGWDISPLNLADAMECAQVLEPTLLEQVREEMAAMKPRPGIYDPDFIAANQSDRATNVYQGSRYEQYTRIREDIRDFRDKHRLHKVFVIWSANTERFVSVEEGVHDTADNLMAAVKRDHSEISPSILYAMAAIDEGCSYINGSPQNTLVGGVVELAARRGVSVAGDDFKSGQTKLKSVLVDFLVSAGIKPTAIVSYNHLGNNDGKNLSAPQQFRSKEITKSNVVDDTVASNGVLYRPGEKPDHVVVIKYVPFVGDSKRAMDEYSSEILLHGVNTIVVHNTCEDSLLAAPLLLDLLLLAELFSRVHFRSRQQQEWSPMHPVLSPLAYLLKAPAVPPGAPVVNALFRQRAAIDNLLRACLGLRPAHCMQLEHKVPFLMEELRSGAMFSFPESPVEKIPQQNGDH